MKRYLPEGAQIVVTETEIETALDHMAEQVQTRFEGKELLMLTVLNGGMIPASLLALRLKLPLEMDYLHASRYRGEAGGDKLTWHARPRAPMTGRHILVVDDILDEGPTLQAIVEYCREQGASSVVSAVLVEKCHDRRVAGAHADIVGVKVEDRYVFGFGMDYRGGLRHLPQVYALAS